MRTIKYKKPKTPQELEQERTTGVTFSDEVYLMNGREFRAMDIHARKRRKATPKDG